MMRHAKTDARRTCANDQSGADIASARAHGALTIAGPLNMSGNIAEWENYRSSTDTETSCNPRWGSFLDAPSALQCASAVDSHRLSECAVIGIRYCATIQ